MKNDKVLVILHVPVLEKEYNCFIPVNKKVQNVINLLVKALYEMNNNNFDLEHNHSLYIKDTGKELNKNIRMRETSVKNAAELIII